jgi:hypothetical protein
LSLNTGVVTYGIKVSTLATPDRKSAIPAEGYLGMPQPSSENWYHSGFLAIALNGKDIGASPVKAARVVESGERGMVEVVWDAPAATVRARFLALTGDDKLFCEIGLAPKTEIQSLSLRATCYPSFFTSWNKQNGHRVVESLASKGEEGAKLELDPQKDWALVYYDTVFDVEAGRGVGPCGMLFLPEQIKSGKIQIGGYPVQTELAVRPDVRAVRMIFWDFKGKTNREAIRRLKGAAAACQKELREISFANRALAAFDFARKKAEAEALAASAKGAEPYAKKIAALDARLGPLYEQMQKASAEGAAPPPGLEDEAMKLIAEREEILWQLKFYALLND